MNDRAMFTPPADRLSPCGPQLVACRCHRTGPVVRTPAQREALHREAVARARRVRPVPTWLPLLTEQERRAAYVRLDERERGAA